MNEMINEPRLTQFSSVQQEIEKSRAIQEVQGAIIMAHTMPRDEEVALRKLKNAARNMRFAEQAIYAYPRGGNMITGPSIRAAEAMAVYWGNLLFGTKELSQSEADHSSELMSYCWDLESNVRSERVFKSKHLRETKKGNYVITSARDVYEKVANDGSRRLRACILAIIPRHITEEFISDCEKTLVGSSGKTIEERAAELLTNFAAIGISKDIIEKKMGVSVDKFLAKNVVTMGYIYNSIKDNIVPASQFFDIPDSTKKQINSSLKSKDGPIPIEAEKQEHTPKDDIFSAADEYYASLDEEIKEFDV
jgi:hypothetical protein